MGDRGREGPKWERRGGGEKGNMIRNLRGHRRKALRASRMNGNMQTQEVEGGGVVL